VPKVVKNLRWLTPKFLMGIAAVIYALAALVKAFHG
jgi:hypothetical protein